MIILGERKEVLEHYFDFVQLVGVSTDNPYALEKEIGIGICRGPKFGTLAQVWPSLKRWR
jgi:hypothetical protein